MSEVIHMAKKIINVFFTVLLIVLIVLVVFIFITRAKGDSPAIFGYRIFRVSSGSMEPELSIGDVILVHTVKEDEIAKGDTITYKGVSGDFKDMMITHKVVEDPYEVNGAWHYQTQGIVPGSLRDPVITYDQVQGKFVSKITFLNSIYTFFLSPAGLITFIMVILVLFAYELISLILSYKSIEVKDEDYYAPAAKKKSKKRKK